MDKKNGVVQTEYLTALQIRVAIKLQVAVWTVQEGLWNVHTCSWSQMYTSYAHLTPAPVENEYSGVNNVRQLDKRARNSNNRMHRSRMGLHAPFFWNDYPNTRPTMVIG